MATKTLFNIISKKDGLKYVDSIYEISERPNYSAQDYAEKRVEDYFSSSKRIETYRYEDWVQWSNEEDWKCVINTTGEELKYESKNTKESEILNLFFSQSLN